MAMLPRRWAPLLAATLLASGANAFAGVAGVAGVGPLRASGSGALRMCSTGPGSEGGRPIFLINFSAN